jgi:hypothetical protein
VAVADGDEHAAALRAFTVGSSVGVDDGSAPAVEVGDAVAVSGGDAVAVPVGVALAQPGPGSCALAGPESRQTPTSSASNAVSAPSAQSAHLDCSPASTAPRTGEPSVSSCLRRGL